MKEEKYERQKAGSPDFSFAGSDASQFGSVPWLQASGTRSV
jgi:hypothetical protein